VPEATGALRRTAAYRYDLPPGAIASEPVEPADAARLLDLTGAETAHRTFRDLPALLQAGDVLVINETKVIRARLRGVRVPGGGAAELLVLRPAAGGPFDASARVWQALVRPGRHLREGAQVRLGGADGPLAEIVLVREDGTRDVAFGGDVPFSEILERYGELPLPPYVGPGDERRAARYQTTFARVPGSVAAPTASLHFTPRVVDDIRARGVTIVPLVLDVGAGTFKPMSGETIDEHAMHAERYAIPETTAAAIDTAKAEGRRIVVAGTTTLRALEASAATNGRVVAGAAETALFVTPGFSFRVADVLLTNFHLPASTLLVLVTAFGGYERVMAAYRTALAQGYRFFSFGDAMLVSRLS
jgi:S-adenosylmethionine:tRNA ribosyltransferase-isomerase